MDWRVNQRDKLFYIDFNPKLGRHLVAARDIELGELILDDYPLVLGPSTFIDLKCSTSPISVCPTCYRKLEYRPNSDDGVISTSSVVPRENDDTPAGASNNDDKKAYKTIGEENFVCVCGLTLCTKACSESSIHVKNECQIFQRVPALHGALEKSVKDLQQFITTIRCLFQKFRDPIKWKQIRELQARIEELDEMGVFDGVNQAFQLLSWEHFKDENDSSHQNNEDVVHMARHCLSALRTNAFSRFTAKISIECLYFFSSFMSHECLMNTDRYFDMDGVRLVTRAARKIPKGQPITTTYLCHLNNNVERQKEMKSVWNFSCECQRCMDPTECGTFLSTIVCPSCNLLTLNPHMIPNADSYNWICSRQDCGYIICDTDADSHLRCTVSQVENDQPDITDLESTEKWLAVYDNGQFLHSNHSIFLQVKLYLCQDYGSGGGMSSLPDDKLLRKSELCKEVIEVLNKLLSGAHLLRGVVYFELWLSLQEMRIRQERENYDSCFDEDDDAIQHIARLAKKILQYGSKNSAEKLMFNILEENE